MTNPTQEYLKTILDYDPATGEFRWKVKKRQNVSVGKIAGALDRTNGYWVIGIDTRKYPASHLAWVMMTGAWPEKFIDHINMVKTDNRFCNLRAATMSQNRANTKAQANNKSGLKGACWRPESGKYRALLRKNGVLHRLGTFNTAEEAHAAYCKAATEFHGEFARSS